jgi:hypothetical protein
MAVIHSQPHSPSRAERQFAELCRNLPDSWHAFFGVEWTRSGSGSEPDRSGEMDAVLYHRDHGILVVEIKGGGVRRDGDRWASLGRTGWHAIKNPLLQVRESAWFLVHELKEIVRKRPGEGFPLVSWALCFPDVEVPRDEWLGQDLLPHQILSRRDLPRLEHRAVEILSRAGHGLHHQRPSESMEASILARFRPCFALLPPAGEMLREEGAQMLEATEHQQQFLLAARSIPRLAVEGCAGSGKSLLAADRARLLSRDGEDVLLLCYSLHLAERWKSLEGLAGVQVDTFHGQARRWIEEAGGVWPEPGDDPEAFELEVERRLEHAQASEPALRRSAVVVDEGQDFRPRWWPLVEGFLERPGEGSLTVFFDPRQNLFRRRIVLPPGLPVFRLSVSVRNTRSIVEWIRGRTGVELQSDPLCPLGEPPKVRRWRDPRDQIHFLREDLQELAAAGIETDRILLVTCLDRDGSALSSPPADLALGWTSPPSTHRPGLVALDSALRVRGLESDVVVLLDVSPEVPVERIYAAATRARHRLLVYEREG